MRLGYNDLDVCELSESLDEASSTGHANAYVLLSCRSCNDNSIKHGRDQRYVLGEGRPCMWRLTILSRIALMCIPILCACQSDCTFPNGTPGIVNCGESTCALMGAGGACCAAMTITNGSNIYHFAEVTCDDETDCPADMICCAYLDKGPGYVASCDTWDDCKSPKLLTVNYFQMCQSSCECRVGSCSNRVCQ